MTMADYFADLTPAQFLKAVASGPIYPYTEHRIPKRRGVLRTVHATVPRLSEIQQGFLARPGGTSPFVGPPWSTSYSQGSNPGRSSRGADLRSRGRSGHRPNGGHSRDNVPATFGHPSQLAPSIAAFRRRCSTS
ncbi:hypothetical protein GCM10010294_64490 [Streptomyces griseoloalbus]|nr:hypothetical protein GCM10010294_64490 [Streptomyces griseoloalbus]